jgi:hypothetical protein
MNHYSATSEDIRRLRYGTGTERLYAAHEGPLIHKWHHYLSLYERYFGPYRNGFTDVAGRRPLRFLEIGVSHGGSGTFWRRFFGPDATIYGIDIDPRCALLDGNAGVKIRIGSQADPSFLKSVVEEMGGVDVVLDDGSHVASHQRASLDTLFPMLSIGGLYMIEDCQTAYWPGYEGGYGRAGTAVEVTKAMIDDMHHWYHSGGQTVRATRGFVTGLHFHDGVIAIDKAPEPQPVHSKMGTPTFRD